MGDSFVPPANSRFTDYPFRESGLTKSQLDWLERRNRAIRLYLDAGDSSLAEEIGLFWNKADEERAVKAQRLRFSDNPFDSTSLSDGEAAERYGPILEKRTKDSIRSMLSLFKPVVEPYTVYRATKGPLTTSEGMEARAGDELWIDGFMSTSRNPSFAAECAVHEFGEGFVFIEVQPLPQAELITLPNEYSGREEYETIINTGQKFRIEKVIVDFEADFHPLDKVSDCYVGTLIPGD